MTSVLDGTHSWAAREARPRALADSCPGLLRPHLAEDGAVVRLRVPGGQTDASALLELSRISEQFGEGSVQLTSRGNVQLRGLDLERLGALVERVSAAGWLPSITHERVRNIVASPLTGLSGGFVDLRPMVSELDAALCSADELAELPGRFLFALDDGRGDVVGLRFDLALVATDASSGVILVGGQTLGIPTPLGDAVGLMVELASRFLIARENQPQHPWHISELASVADLDGRLEALKISRVPAGAPELGAVGAAASVGVPLSLLDRPQVEAVYRAADGGAVVLTPWRGLVVPGAAAALPALAEVGLVTDSSSVWSQLTGCIGAPGCAKSAISTRKMASALSTMLAVRPTLPIHVSGCARRCGAPAGEHVELVAPTSLAGAMAEIERRQ